MALRAVVASVQPSMFTVPELPDFCAETRLLVIAPHPDDETIATGLLIQRVRAAGGEVKILLLTAGDDNPWPQRWIERRVRVGAADRRRWGRRRQAELERALQRLDVPWQSLQMLDWPDMGVTDVLLQRHDEAMAMLAAAIDTFHPSVIAMPSIDDRHPDHGAAYVLVRLALAERTDPPKLLTYLIHGHAPHDRFVEVAGTVAQRSNKLDALTAHHTQMALSGRRLRRLAAQPERYSDVLPTMKNSVAALPWQPPAWLSSRLWLSVAGPSHAQTWRWTQAPLQRDGEGSYYLASGAENLNGPCFAKLTCDLPSPWIFDHWGWREI